MGIHRARRKLWRAARACVDSKLLCRACPSRALEGFLARENWEPVRLPVKARPHDFHPVGDALELVAAVGVSGDQLVERSGLGQIAEAILARLGHFHVAREVAAIPLTRKDPEPFGRLLGEEPRLLAGRHRAQEEARREADRARGRRDEVREIAKRAEIAGPALAGDQLGEWRLA